MQLWIAVREDQTIVGAQITQITDYPSKRMLTSMFTGGSAVRGWRDLMMARLEDWARANQCVGIEGEGRAGWVKLLERYGVKQRLISYEKDL